MAEPNDDRTSEPRVLAERRAKLERLRAEGVEPFPHDYDGRAEIGVVPNKSALQHHTEAAYNALADAGLTVKDVDGVFTAGYSTLATAEYMGIKPKFTDATAVGGSSFVIHIAHAVAAIHRLGFTRT